MISDTTNILYITDNKYVYTLLTSLASLQTNKYPSSRYKVFVICDNVCDEYKNLILKFNRDDFQIEIIDFNQNHFQKKSYEKSKYITNTTYIRLYIGEMEVFENMDKILYLDGDLIVQDDLTELYNADMTNNSVGGILDFGLISSIGRWDVSSYLKPLIEQTNCYINAGVLLFNLKWLRENDFLNRAMDMYDNRKDFKFADQDIINFTLSESIRKFSPLYNLQVFNFFDYIYNIDEPKIKKNMLDIYGFTYDNSPYELISQAKIIHFSGSKDIINKISGIREINNRYLRIASDICMHKGG